MKNEIWDKKRQQNTKKITYTTWVTTADEIDLLCFLKEKHIFKKQTDFF